MNRYSISDFYKQDFRYNKNLAVSTVIITAFIVSVKIYLDLTGFNPNLEYKVYIIMDIIIYILFFLNVLFLFIIILKFEKGHTFFIISTGILLVFLLSTSITLYIKALSDIKGFYLGVFLTTLAMVIIIAIIFFRMIWVNILKIKL